MYLSLLAEIAVMVFKEGKDVLCHTVNTRGLSFTVYRVLGEVKHNEIIGLNRCKILRRHIKTD